MPSQAIATHVRTTNRVERARLLLMSTRYKAELGAAIKKRRLELGLTQKALAELTHHQESQTVSRWERGENLPSDLEVVATALRWTLPEMMAGIVPPDRRAARRLGIADPPEGTPDPFGDSQLDRIEAKVDHLSQAVDQLGQKQSLLTETERELLRQVEAFLNRLGRDVGRGQPLQRTGPQSLPAAKQAAS